jgi:DNA-binding NtrC family response regulator
MQQGAPFDIVIIDDDVLHARHLSRIATAYHLGTHHLGSSQIDPRGDALERAPLAQLAIIKSDDDTELVRRITLLHPDMTTIVLKDGSQAADVLACVRAGARDVLPADLSNPEALARLKRHFGQCRPRGASRSGDRLGAAPSTRFGLAGASAAMKQIRDTIERLGNSDTTTLIEGPTGVGKELVALALHNYGRRAGGPLIAVNCGATPDDLLEGEFFGYEKGAFSGAVNSYPGKLALADGGTLFLDEIGELSMAGQVKLLRALEAKQCYRLGGRKAHDFNIRIVAATNRRLEDEVAAGRFRSDLFYRIAVARIKVPKLVDRRADIAPLAQHFLHQIAAAAGTTPPRLDACAMAVLEAHDWPGNARELRNAIEVALINPEQGSLRQEDFAFLPKNNSRPSSTTAAQYQPVPELTISSIGQALHSASGNKSEAARILGCSRMTLYRHLRRN